VKLLFDANLSHRLVQMVADLFPDSIHVRNAMLAKASDDTIWQYAKEHNFIIVSKDIDFHEHSLLRGFPPKTIWIRKGNCSTTAIAELLRNNAEGIKRFHSDAENSCLILI